jgi:hypothetical protein
MFSIFTLFSDVVVCKLSKVEEGDALGSPPAPVTLLYVRPVRMLGAVKPQASLRKISKRNGYYPRFGGLTAVRNMRVTVFWV